MQCNTRSRMYGGCFSQCFNTLGMSHMRFWFFQILASLVPIMFLWCLITNIEGNMKKKKKIEEEIEKRKNKEHEGNRNMDKLIYRTRNKRPIVTHQWKTTYSGNEKIEILYSNMLEYAFLGCLVVRFAIELTTIYFGSELFIQVDQRIKDGVRPQPR